MKRIVLGLSGASGAPYAKRLIEVLRGSGLGTSPTNPEVARSIEISLVLSRTAETVWQHECGGSPRALGLPCYDGRDYAAPFASGSSAPDAMAIVPASMSSIARIAHGISDDLLTRAADVVLKERKPLVVVPREAPYSSIHLENMLALTRAGAVVVPASPSFYGRPQSLQDAIDSVLARVLDHLGLPNTLSKRWGQDINLEASHG
ncbi:MAG TPA: UbiX family flavin prenyltransferase [Polyangiales bacterium]|nr:UbiX family flavin prenyltransferase [Polyangiales bacterium]